MEGRDENSQQREHARRRSSPMARSRSPSPPSGRGRAEYRDRRRHSDENYKRGGENVAHQHPVSARNDEQYNRGKNGREHRSAVSPTYQHHEGHRFDDRGYNRRIDNYDKYNTGSRGEAQRAHDEGHQRRNQSPNHAYRGQQQRGRDRPYPSDEREERRDNRGEFRDQQRGNRDWRGPPDERDRNRRDRNEDREREAPRGSRPVEVKVERTSSSPRGHSRSHNSANQSESAVGQRRGRDRSPMGRGPRRAPFRPGQDNEEDQFEWGGGRRNADSQQPGKPHVPRTIKAEDRTVVKKEEPGSDSEPPPKQKPNFELSGKLTEETNKVNGTVIAYAEPPGARKPKRRWRLYPFKGEQALPTLYIHRQSAYLIGRDRKVCDLPVDHPSCSKQHAVFQYRLVPYQKEDGSMSQRVRPYIIDLESANGTFVNNKKIEPKRYLELFEKDVLKFGFSTREYVLLHENSKDDNEDEGYEVSPTSKPFAGANSNVGPN
ncbi:hypothetical protein ZHAS_00013774 [Anopheles sinensis]|uniref:FHA domain-containing protein n=1 Tax=Anopheles sinensis TaxID=74873 RepID=A0A084W682_ANOSI|nr:hypothetical protein ZHAS_00013774 [Anopheles sinensis]